MLNNLNNNSNPNFLAFKKKQYQDIYAHEKAHKNAGGALAGPIVIEKNSDGVATGGHVSIQMPKLDESNPDDTIKKAQIVIKAALAPHDPSGQDYKVASEARAVLARANALKKEGNFTYSAAQNVIKQGEKIDYTA